MDFLSLSWWRVVFAKGGRAFALGCALVFILPIVITAGFSLRPDHSQQQAAQAGTIATVNGQPITTQEFDSISSDNLAGAPGQAHAAAYGRAIFTLIQNQVLQQLAKKQNVHASDADVDRAVAQERESKLGPNASSTDFENYLSDQKHTTLADFRDSMENRATGQALFDHYKKAEIVTVDDAKSQYSEVKLSTVYVASQSPTSGMRGAPKSLPDAEALKQVTDLHAKALAGADIAAMAETHSDPFSRSRSTGISDWTPENKESQLGSSFMFGKEFDTAVRKTAKGQITDVVKATGFMNGYVFAKVVDRRVELPKDYDVNKETASIQQDRALKKLEADLKTAVDAAKIVFAKDQPGMKAYYDYAKLQMMQQDMSGGVMGNPSPNPPSQAGVEAQKTLVNNDFEALLKAQPDDSTAVLMVAQNLQNTMVTEPLAEQAKTRDRLISLYETAFKTTEDIPTRFVLAGLYHDKQDYKSAFKQYAMVAKLLSGDPPYDLPTRQKDLATRTQLLTGLNGLPAASVPEVAAAIADDAAKIETLKPKIAEDQRKQAEQQKLDQEKAAQDAKDAAAAKLKAKSTPAPGTPATSGTGAAPGAAPPPPTTAASGPGSAAPPAPAPAGSSGAANSGPKK